MATDRSAGLWGFIQPGFQREDFSIHLWRQALAEFIAVMLFVFIGAGAVIVTSAHTTEFGFQPNNVPPSWAITAIALAFSFGIAALVAATASISGGHLNPAVSFAAALTGKMKISTAAVYIIAQCAGAVVAALLLKAIIAGPFEGHLGATALSSSGLLEDQLGDGAGAGLLVEIILTFALVFAVFATAIDPRGPSNLAPLAIGFVVLVDHFIGVPLTGASMNPARSFGPAVVANFWPDHWIYWAGPLIGGGIAALIYELFFMYREDEPAAATVVVEETVVVVPDEPQAPVEP